MDKTYAEVCSRPSFDWDKFLQNPPHHGSLEHNRASFYGHSWVTCACGNQCAIIERDSIGSPVDDELRTHGRRFAMEIRDAEWPAARATLAAIEARSAVLIQQELAKLNP